MGSQETSDGVAPAEKGMQRLDQATRLALERTRVAYVRTVMAAVRTATSLITFGFTVYKFFELEVRDRDDARQLVGPREFGITLILIGLVSLLLGVFEYRRDLKEMRRLYSDMPQTTAGVIAAMIGAIGIIALLVAILRQ